MKILVVDDDPATLLVASMALETVGGFQVIQADSGLDAVRCAQMVHPDAILMDFVMSDLDGPQVLQMLRACSATANIPIIFHTAKTEPSEIKRLMDLGAKGVIRKPFDPMALSKEISHILND